MTLNRYICRAAGLPEYLDDIRTALQDGRIAHFDVYEFFDLAQASPDQPGLVPKGERITALKARWQTIAASL